MFGVLILIRMNIYKCAKPCTGNWTQEDGELVQLSQSNNHVWGVNSSNNIYKTKNT